MLSKPSLSYGRPYATHYITCNIPQVESPKKWSQVTVTTYDTLLQQAIDNRSLSFPGIVRVH